MEKIVTEYEAAQQRCQEYLDDRKSELSSVRSSVKQQEIEEWKARQYAEQLREEANKKEQIIRLEQTELEEEFRRRHQKELNEQMKKNVNIY
jgi:hypothetical protein